MQNCDNCQHIKYMRENIQENKIDNDKRFESNESKLEDNQKEHITMRERINTVEKNVKEEIQKLTVKILGAAIAIITTIIATGILTKIIK